MARKPEGMAPQRNRPDWRGWIAVVWVLVWGWAYAVMAVQARAPQVVSWFQSLTAGD